MKNFIKGQIILALVVSLGLAVVSCSQKKESGLIGKWVLGTNEATVTFMADGKARNEEGGLVEDADYTVTDGNLLKLTMKEKDKTVTIQFKMAFLSENELQLTPPTPTNMPNLPPDALKPLVFKRAEK